VRDVEGLREHYALTCRAWVANLEERWEKALRLVSSARARVWRLYLAGSALAFEGRRVGGQPDRGDHGRRRRLKLSPVAVTAPGLEPSASPVASTKVVCDGPGDQRALHVEAATA
jgi:hypothetical protein